MSRLFDRTIVCLGVMVLCATAHPCLGQNELPVQVKVEAIQVIRPAQILPANPINSWNEAWTLRSDQELKQLLQMQLIDSLQFEELKEKFKVAIPETVKEFNNLQLRQGNLVAPGFRFQKGVPASVDHVARYESMTEEIYRQVLRPEQFGTLMREKEAKQSFVLQTMVQCIMNRLDQHLMLSEVQQSNLIEPITKWCESNIHGFDLIVDQPNYLPQMPVEVIAPCLSKTQLQLWHQIPKQGVISNGPVIWVR